VRRVGTVVRVRRLRAPVRAEHEVRAVSPSSHARCHDSDRPRRMLTGYSLNRKAKRKKETKEQIM